MPYELIRATYEIVMPILMILFYLKVVDSQKLIITVQKEVIQLIANFRKELHNAINTALALHIKEYHK